MYVYIKYINKNLFNIVYEMNQHDVKKYALKWTVMFYVLEPVICQYCYFLIKTESALHEGKYIFIWNKRKLANTHGSRWTCFICFHLFSFWHQFIRLLCSHTTSQFATGRNDTLTIRNPHLHVQRYSKWLTQHWQLMKDIDESYNRTLN